MMKTLNHQQTVCCPNCGAKAQRFFFMSYSRLRSIPQTDRIIHTECPICDYLMIMSSLNGRVIEAQN